MLIMNILLANAAVADDCEAIHQIIQAFLYISVLYLTWERLSQDFPPESYLPKVQLPFYTEPGQRPRKIEIERRVFIL